MYVLLFWDKIFKYFKARVPVISVRKVHWSSRKAKRQGPVTVVQEVTLEKKMKTRCKISEFYIVLERIFFKYIQLSLKSLGEFSNIFIF